MNIIVKPYGGDFCYCRPDTTWERENRDFYSPECVNEIYWTPIIFARISKAGKCIGHKFAGRYYDGIGYGMLMYCNNTDIAFSSCADHTSILPHPLHHPEILDCEQEFAVMKNCDQLTVISSACNEWRNLLENALCKASRLTSLRIGDFIALELDKVKSLATPENGDTEIKGLINGTETFNFKIIF